MPVLKPGILPEDTAPDDAKSCEKCELYQHGGRVIWGEGDPASAIFVILDNPGAREDKNGRPYLCGTRETMQQAAIETGFNPGSLYITYLLKCRPRRAYNKEAARSICSGHLWNQVQKADPKILFCLGNVACQAVMENPSVEVKNIRGQINKQNNYLIIASYHPLAVRRRPALYKFFLHDWELVAKVLGEAKVSSSFDN